MTAFFIEGKVVGQGAIRYSRQGFGYHANGKELKPWRDKIAAKAKDIQVPLLLGPVELELNFFLERPKTVKRDYPTTAPDLDHYIRACGDALKGVAYKDDAQVVDITTKKRYADNGQIPGVRIRIREIL